MRNTESEQALVFSEGKGEFVFPTSDSGVVTTAERGLNSDPEQEDESKADSEAEGGEQETQVK